HVGGPLNYTTIDPEGDIQTFVLGPDPTQGHCLQRVVPGGYWKASELLDGSFGLISEAVVPAFSPEDRTIGKRSELAELFPRAGDVLRLAWDDEGHVEAIAHENAAPDRPPAEADHVG